MWYIIIQILFVIIGCILATSYSKYLKRKKHNRPYDNIYYTYIFLASLIWPIAIIFAIGYFIYVKYVKEKLNNFIDKLSEIWENMN